MCVLTALNFLLGMNSCQHFNAATCFLCDIQQVVLPPERLGLQPRDNFTLWKNGNLDRAGAAKATHLLPSDHRLVQDTASVVWVHDIMTVTLWATTLPAGRGIYLVLWSRGYSPGSCGLAAACMVLIYSCSCDWLCTHCRAEEHRQEWEIPEKVESQTGTSCSAAIQPAYSGCPLSKWPAHDREGTFSQEKKEVWGRPGPR